MDGLASSCNVTRVSKSQSCASILGGSFSCRVSDTWTLRAAAGIPALRMQHWLKPSFTEESDDGARADLARKPDPFFPAASPNASAAQRSSNGARPAAFSNGNGNGAGSAAPSEADCDPSGGPSAADWVLAALSKPSSSQNGASGRPASGGSASSSDSSSRNGASKTPSWLAGSKQRVIDLDAAANRGSAAALDPEPWVHNGAAGSGAEALARATLRSASAPIDVPSAGPRLQQHHKASEKHREQHRVRSSGRPSGGHTDDEVSSSDDDGGSASLSDADSLPAMSPEATERPDAPSSSLRADTGSQRRADGSADYII